MNYYIITGASKGLGEAIVKQLAEENNYIIYMSRTSNQLLEKQAVERGAIIQYEECDLTNVEVLGVVFKRVFEKIDLKKARKITLINNAGMIEPIKNVGYIDELEMIANVKVNLLAPMLLCEYFVRETKEFTNDAIIVNVTSGAANRPMAGWSIYCSTKSGLNMLTNTIGIEQENRPAPITVIGFSPGIMNTDMQGIIRTASKEDFALIDQFKEYHEKGMLRSPDMVAKLLVRLLSSNLDNGRVYDVKELL